MNFFRELRDNHAPSVNFGTRPDSGSQQPIYNEQQSQYSPRVFNANNNDVVHTRLYILEGSAGPMCSNADSSIVVYHHVNSFPSLRYQVTDGYFKALVHLNPGVNNLRLVWEDSNNPNSNNYSEITLNYVPLLQNPPLHFALIVANDSPLEFDSPQYKKDQDGGNNVDIAVKKVRLAAYMMAAYTNEQMRRGGYGHRTFRIQEDYVKDTLSERDESLRSTAKIHIIKSNRSTEEIRDPNRAQQNSEGNDRGGLFGIALEAIQQCGIEEFKDQGENVRIVTMFLDTHWDPDAQLITGHAALGGGAGHIKLAIFGSHALWSFPTSLEQITSCLLDTNKVDTSQVARDCSEDGTAWEVFDVGFGAWLHEVGHLLDCPHEPYGIMRNDWWMNRSFMSREAFCAGTKSEGKRPLRPEDDSAWHPLDLVRFRFHPAFRSPFETKVKSGNFALYPLEHGIYATSISGIYMVEIYSDDDMAGNLIYSKPRTEWFLSEDELMNEISEERFKDSSRVISLWLHAAGGEQYQIKNFREMLNSNRIEDSFNLDKGTLTAFQSYPIGGCEGEEKTTYFPRYVSGVNVRSGDWINGVDFIAAPGGPSECSTIGTTGGDSHELFFDRDEYITGFHIRTGGWVDAFQVITNKRRGPLLGNPNGGTPANVMAPEGYQIVGVKAHNIGWLTSFSIIYVPRC